MPPRPGQNRPPYPLSRQDQAASEVIGTVLMVAMTVMLASILYLWAASFMVYTEPPPVYGTDHYRTGDGDYIVEIVSASAKKKIDVFHWYLKDAQGRTVVHGNLTVEGGNETVEALVGGRLGDGDKFIIDPDTLDLSSLDGYTFQIKYNPSGDMVVTVRLRG